tara:strand:- start:1268 stop:1855 length:588 start_codon:yes stop_codon:yes gene_type:complete
MKKNILIYISLFLLTCSSTLKAQEPFVGEIRMFAGNFAPRGWAFCDGQLLAISSNDALFSLIGTTYGGDGRTTFALPDFRGRLPVQHGQGPGLSNVRLGEKFGQENVVLNTTNLPAHTHPVYGVVVAGSAATPSNNYPANTNSSDPEYATSGTSVQMNTGVVGDNVTSNTAINNRQPSVGIHYIIALVGIYPSRS